jgi:anti-sigma factor RsiW
VQAYFDGEVDALLAADIERHAERCAECRALLQDLERARTLIRRELDYGEAPPALRERIARMLDEESAAGARAVSRSPPRASRTRPFWMGAAGGLGVALAASVALFFLFPAAPEPLLDALVAAHVRSLMPQHLTDVMSTDQHTVKPWYAGHADVSPVVADLAPQGYRLVGGRADYFDGQRVAVAVYEHGPHVINVFTWAGGRRSFPSASIRNGYHLVFWRAGNLQYCAVSDAGWDELQGLVRLLRGLSARDAPP